MRLGLGMLGYGTPGLKLGLDLGFKVAHPSSANRGGATGAVCPGLPV